MEDMDGLSKWWISEILMDDDNIQFQLVNGYFSFKMESAGLPYYVEWIEKYKELYGFTVAWKYFVSDDDLSVWFNT